MPKMCSVNLVMQQVISRLQQDLEVITRLSPRLYVCLYVSKHVCLLARSRSQESFNAEDW